jgi:hypothetical protein
MMARVASAAVKKYTYPIEPEKIIPPSISQEVCAPHALASSPVSSSFRKTETYQDTECSSVPVGRKAFTSYRPEVIFFAR